MNRKERRRIIREWYKDVKKMTLREFEIFVLGIDEDSRKIVGQIYEEALRTDFGFGDVRIERLNNSAEKVYERLINEAEQEVNQE